MTLTRRHVLAGAAAVAAAAATPLRARAADELRIAFVPEVATTADSISSKQPFIAYFEKATGRTIKLVIPTNYAATVEAIGNGSVDLAHFGGLTFLKANAQYGAVPLVQRIDDRAFHSLFITNAPAVKTLADVRGKSFAFGDVSSTSGHLIPAKDLLAAGIDPEHDIVARFSGNHTNTAIAVNSGQVVAGALDETVYRKLIADKTIDAAHARVFHTSEPFVDYVWAVRKDLDPALTAKIKTGFLTLRDPAVLALLRGSRYVAADNAEYDPLREIARKLDLL
jgi:phosphonate transport system substrate-binding protein